MQALLSRTAQARTSCRCMSCGQAAKGVARQTTTAAPKRRIGAGDIFTACYSTILASAAIVDAGVKRERRKEWDRVIEEARSEKPILEAGERGLDLELDQTTYSKISTRSSSAYEDPSSSRPWWSAQALEQDRGPAIDSPLQGKLKELDLRIKQSLGSAVKMATAATIEGATLIDEAEDVVEEWADEHALPGTGFREPQSDLHLTKAEDSASRLVMQLLGEISIFATPSPKSPNKETKAVLEAIEGLHSSFSKFPNFSWCRQDDVQARSTLHTSIYKICHTKISGESGADSIIAKICYNLLISTSPPSIITYNILIGELSRLRLHDVAQVIINSYFCDTRFAPTMETTKLMLDHYIAKGDRKGFNDLLDRLRCTLPAARSTPGKSEPRNPLWNMRIGARSIKLLYLPEVQEWAVQQKAIHRNGLMVRKAPRDSGVFESIIKGCLEFNSIRRATHYLKAAFREGQIIRSEWIYAIATDCVKSVDHKTGRILMDALLSFWKDDEGNSLMEFSRNFRYAIYQVLGLCGVIVRDGSLKFNTNHLLYRKEDLQELVLNLQVESGEEPGMGSAGRMLNLQSGLGHQIRQGQCRDAPEDRHKFLALSQNKILQGQIKLLERRLLKSAGRLGETQNEVLSWTYDYLSPISQEMYNSDIERYCPSRNANKACVKRLQFLSHLFQKERRQVQNSKEENVHVEQIPSNIKTLEWHTTLDEPKGGVAFRLGICH